MSRLGMQEYFGQVRAYFAPVNAATGQAAVFDPATAFNPDAPLAPWVELGLVRNFQRVAKATAGAVRSGVNGVAQEQFRKLVDVRVSLDFGEWGKLQMALAGGSQMNVLETAGTAARASGGVAKVGQPVLAGSTASAILLDASVLANYAVGELVVVDVDYVTGMTALGTGPAGGVAATGAALDADAVRRVSYNVAAVTAVTATGMQLDRPLLGGVPVAGARVQKVVAFVDREGASYVPEWSALFVLEESSGGQVYFHYPRLQSAVPAEESVTALMKDSGVNGAAIHAEFAALAVTDANDGESVVCYRSYVPAAGVAAW